MPGRPGAERRRSWRWRAGGGGCGRSCRSGGACWRACRRVRRRVRRGVRVLVGVAVGVAVCPPTASYAPMSQCGPWGRAMPRWSRLLTGAAAQMASFACVNRRAAWAERHRMGRAAVILQRTEHGVAVDAGTGGVGIAEVPAAVGDGAVAVASRWAVGDDRVLQRHRASFVLMPPPPTGGAVAGEGAVAHGQRAPK